VALRTRRKTGVHACGSHWQGRKIGHDRSPNNHPAYRKGLRAAWPGSVEQRREGHLASRQKSTRRRNNATSKWDAHESTSRRIQARCYRAVTVRSCSVRAVTGHQPTSAAARRVGL
jgi:hypothetical protein